MCIPSCSHLMNLNIFMHRDIASPGGATPEDSQEERYKNEEEMEFFMEHTKFATHMKECEDQIKHKALKEWVQENGALTTLIPVSLRDMAAKMAVDDMLNTYCIPPDLRKKARRLVKGLEDFDAMLTLELEMADRLSAATNAYLHIVSWGLDAVAFFDTEADILAATEELYKSRRAASQAMWGRSEFVCLCCQKRWGKRQQLVDHFRGRHGVVPVLCGPKCSDISPSSPTVRHDHPLT